MHPTDDQIEHGAVMCVLCEERNIANPIPDDGGPPLISVLELIDDMEELVDYTEHDHTAVVPIGGFFVQLLRKDAQLINRYLNPPLAEDSAVQLMRLPWPAMGDAMRQHIKMRMGPDSVEEILEMFVQELTLAQDLEAVTEQRATTHAINESIQRTEEHEERCGAADAWH